MDIQKRKVLYIITTLIFVIVTPILLMYALGYTYNTKKRKIEFDGGVYLKFEPKNADIVINGTSYRKQSPFELTNLYPGTHEVSISTPGFASWNKTIQVEPRQTITFPTINLFPLVLPEQINTSQIPNELSRQQERDTLLNRFRVHPSANGLVLTLTNTLSSTTIPLATSTLQYIIPGTAIALVFDEHSHRLALIDGSRMSLSTHLFEDVQNVITTKASTLFWTPFELWSIQRDAERPELITRVSEGIVTADLFNESYVIYATKLGMIYATELSNTFGRVNQLLATFVTVEILNIKDTETLLIRGKLTHTGKLGWFSLRLK